MHIFHIFLASHCRVQVLQVKKLAIYVFFCDYVTISATTCTLTPPTNATWVLNSLENVQCFLGPANWGRTMTEGEAVLSRNTHTPSKQVIPAQEKQHNWTFHIVRWVSLFLNNAPDNTKTILSQIPPKGTHLVTSYTAFPVLLTPPNKWVWPLPTRGGKTLPCNVPTCWGVGPLQGCGNDCGVHPFRVRL